MRKSTHPGGGGDGTAGSVLGNIDMGEQRPDERYQLTTPSDSHCMTVEVIRRSFLEDHLAPESGQGLPRSLLLPFHQLHLLLAQPCTLF